MRLRSASVSDDNGLPPIVLGNKQFEFEAAYEEWPNKAVLEVIHHDDYEEHGINPELAV